MNTNSKRSQRLIIIVLLAIVVLFSSATGTKAESPVWGIDVSPVDTFSGDFSSDRVIVKFKQGALEDAINNVLSDVGVQRLKAFKYVGISVLEVSDKSRSIKELMTDLEKSGIVEYAEPDYILHLNVTPNDPQFGSLWGLHNTGQSGGTPDADIDAPEAWDINTGDPNIVVGVIDSGVDYTHQDLAANMWVNPGETPGNGIDDDSNGYVDDVYGINAITGSGNPFDDNDHGTHVSGTIGAVGNNGIGVVGVNWDVSIMALKFLDANGSGWTSDAVECLNYAIMMKANYGVNIKVTNNSWGGSGYSQSLYDAIAASGSAGMLFMAAAGNDYGNNNDISPAYPASYNLSNIMAVAATDRYDNLAYSSNYGPTTVDLGAPGSSIYSTLPGNSYGTKSGTSMATPHVSGAAALIWAQNPSFDLNDVKNAILYTVDPLISLSGLVLSGGRLNIYNALSSTLDSPIPDIKANDSDGPITINRGDNLTVTLSLDPGSHDGENADWWIVAFYYEPDTGSWLLGMENNFQGPLFDLSSYTFLNEATTNFPAEYFVFYFVVDLNPNGSFDPDQLYFDSVAVTIQ